MNDIVQISDNDQTRRVPSQERSRSRVDQILNATRDIILEKGTGGLKIHELAERAGVTPSSIYQYFPNKRAIISALDMRYIDETNGLLGQALEGVKTLEEAFKVMEDCMDDYYAWYKSEPVIADIWYGLAADKALQDMELQSSRDAASIVVDKLAPFIDEADLPELESYALLLTHLAGSTIRLCIMTSDEEGERLKESFKNLLKSMRLTLI